MPVADRTVLDGRWVVQLDGFPPLTTDDMTLEDVELAERVCNVPWVLLNPLASAKEAKAFLAILLVRSGVPEDEAVKAATKTPMPKLARAFRYELPERKAQPATVTPGEGDDGPPS